MGKAQQQAVVDAYAQRFAVMEHAVQRFRERADAYLREAGCLEDEAVRLRLDLEVRQVLDAGGGHAISDNGEPAQLVHLEGAGWGSLWALIKENHHRRFPQRQAIVTCLTDWMVAQSIIDGRYTGNVPHVPRFARVIEQRTANGPETTPSHGTPSLGTPSLGTPAHGSLAPGGGGSGGPAAVLVAGPGEAPTRPHVLAPRPEELRLVVHETSEGPSYAQLPREAVAAHIEALLRQGVALAAIRVWRPASPRVRLDFD
jgi:hypothetical protein